MKKIYTLVLLLGAASPAFGLSSAVGDNPQIGGDVIDTACGCTWSTEAAEQVPSDVKSTCNSCGGGTSIKPGGLGDVATCIDDICDDRKAGNANGVIVGSKKKLTVDCGTWVPNGKPDDTGTIQLGYWSRYPTASCDDVPTYRCGAGYYGSATSETSGCTRCPGYTTDMDGVRPTASNNQYVVSSKDPRESITDCYVMKYSVSKDDTGSFFYTDGCVYEKPPRPDRE